MEDLKTERDSLKKRIKEGLGKYRKQNKIGNQIGGNLRIKTI